LFDASISVAVSIVDVENDEDKFRGIGVAVTKALQNKLSLANNDTLPKRLNEPLPTCRTRLMVLFMTDLRTHPVDARIVNADILMKTRFSFFSFAIILQ
jgi:hypothetical protein